MTVLAALRGALIVSCQPLPDEPADPLRDARAQALIAKAAVLGGAGGIRANTPEHVGAIRCTVDVPVIGLWKDGRGEVVITPSAGHALAVASAGANVVAVDATARPRPDGRAFRDTVAVVHGATSALVLADIATEDEALAAVDAGADAVATTLSVFRPERAAIDGPDLALVERLAGRLHVPVIAEGRYRTPEQIRNALDAGAHAVVSGNAVTSPLWITRRLVAGIPNCHDRTGVRQKGNRYGYR